MVSPSGGDALPVSPVNCKGLTMNLHVNTMYPKELLLFWVWIKVLKLKIIAGKLSHIPKRDKGMAKDSLWFSWVPAPFPLSPVSQSKQFFHRSGGWMNCFFLLLLPSSSCWCRRRGRSLPQRRSNVSPGWRLALSQILSGPLHSNSAEENQREGLACAYSSMFGRQMLAPYLENYKATKLARGPMVSFVFHSVLLFQTLKAETIRKGRALETLAPRSSQCGSWSGDRAVWMLPISCLRKLFSHL